MPRRRATLSFESQMIQFFTVGALSDVDRVLETGRAIVSARASNAINAPVGGHATTMPVSGAPIPHAVRKRGLPKTNSGAATSAQPPLPPQQVAEQAN